MAGIKQIGTNRKDDQDKWLLKSIDTHLASPQRPARKGVFYPSALGSLCDRHLYNCYFGLVQEQEIDAVTKRVFDCGDYLGYRYQKYFERMGILVATESPVKSEMPPISGRLDFLIRHDQLDSTNSKRPVAVIELKSINQRGFKALLKPKDDHYIQIQLYLNLTGYEYGIVLYENKDDQKIKAFSVAKNEATWNTIKERCLKIMNMTEQPKECTGLRYCPCRREK